MLAQQYHAGHSTNWVRGGDWHLWFGMSVVAVAAAVAIGIAIMGYQKELASRHRFDSVSTSALRIGDGTPVHFSTSGSSSISGSIPAGASTAVVVTLPKGYQPPALPRVIATVQANAAVPLAVMVSDVSRTGFTAHVFNWSGASVDASGVRVNWSVTV